MMATWSVFGAVALTISLAGSAEADVVPAGDSAAPAVVPPMIAVRAVPGADLPPSLAEDVRAAVENVLTGRTRAAGPIELTLDAAGVDVRVGSLARRVFVLHWDDVALRTVALHVLDLTQPAPEVVVAAAPGEGVVPVSRTAEPSPPPTWGVRAGVAGLRGIDNGTAPWWVAFAAGGFWTHEWWRVGAELGWDRAPETLANGTTPVTYDAWPVRVAAAAQASMLEAGIRAGVEAFRVTATRSTWSVTPLAGVFVGIRLPATPWLHAVLVGGADVLSRRVQLTVGPEIAYTTPRLVPYAGLMIEVGVKP